MSEENQEVKSPTESKEVNVENKEVSNENLVDELKKVSKTSETKAKKAKPQSEVIPRGLPKSKRPWKTPKQRFATIKKSVNRLSFEKKMALRNELRHIKEVSNEIKEQRKEAKVLKHQRRIENAERRLANERRAEIVQIIKNPAKLKRMKKKQMRMIQKRDLSQVKVV